MWKIFAMSLAISAAAAVAQSAEPQATSQPAPADPSDTQTAARPNQQADKVTVLSVAGPAERLVVEGDQQKWTALKEGEELDEMTVIRTGLRAKVVLRFADRGEVTVNNASKMGISEFRKEGEQVTSRLGLKYGTIRASIEKGRGPNDFRVSTPVATLSIQGSGADVVALVDSPMIIKSFSGAWKTVTSSGSRTVHAGEATNQTLSQWADIAKQQREARMAAVGETPIEQDSLTDNGGGRGIFGPAASTFDSGGSLIPPPPPPPPPRPPVPPRPPEPPPPVPPPHDQ
jgi:hypothetical protein